MRSFTEEENKKIVLEAFDKLFNRRDYAAAERYWSPDYIQHSAHIESGREGLFNLIKSLPPTLRYEPGLVVGEGDFVIVHGRFSGFGQPVNWIAADILKMKERHSGGALGCDSGRGDRGAVEKQSTDVRSSVPEIIRYMMP